MTRQYSRRAWHASTHYDFYSYSYSYSYDSYSLLVLHLLLLLLLLLRPVLLRRHVTSGGAAAAGSSSCKGGAEKVKSGDTICSESYCGCPADWLKKIGGERGGGRSGSCVCGERKERERGRERKTKTESPCAARSRACALLSSVCVLWFWAWTVVGRGGRRAKRQERKVAGEGGPKREGRGVQRVKKERG
eukprot:774556-Rhodomonas_salina.2